MNTSAKRAKMDISGASPSRPGTEVLALSDEPVVRQSRVIELNERIQQGAFCPANDEVAQAILRDLTRPLMK